MKVKFNQVHCYMYLRDRNITITESNYYYYDPQKVFLGGGSMSICPSICSSDFHVWQTTFLKRNIRGSYLAWSCLWLCLWSSSLTKVKVIPSSIWYLRNMIYISCNRMFFYLDIVSIKNIYYDFTKKHSIAFFML